MSQSAPDVIVIGGGVIGCAVAYGLRRAGASVTLVERSRIGAESSSAAAGILAPRVHATTSAIFELALASHRLFPDLVATARDDTGMDAELVRSGVLDLAYDGTAVASLHEKVRWLRELGHDVRWLDDKQCQSLEPGLAPEVRGGFFDADAYHINPARFTQALGQAAGRRGVEIRLGTEVVGIRFEGARATHVQTTGGEIAAGHVVLATGAWMGEWGARLNLAIPVFPAKGQIMTVYAAPLPLRKIVFGLEAYLLPRVDGTVVVGATVERAGFDRSLTVEGMAWLLKSVSALCPALAGAAFDHAWTGFRPGSPDELPIVGPAPGWANVTLATGHFRNGIMLAPITAELLTKLVLHEERDALLAPLDPARFQTERRLA
jgi:glycine oxidase